MNPEVKEPVVDVGQDVLNAKQSDGVVVLIPAFNEDRFIGSVVLKARQYAQVVFVADDGSQDRTAYVAEMAGAQVIRCAKNRGKGMALRRGLKAVREMGASVVVIMDADVQHDPADIPKLVNAIRNDNADLVIGSRFLKNPNQAPGYRRLGQRMVTWMTNTASGVRVSDTWSGFRALVESCDCTGHVIRIRMGNGAGVAVSGSKTWS